jgi:diguanylate cyclase
MNDHQTIETAPMRYTESKDRSSELLRMTLRHMGLHDAAFNPITFTVWYEYSAGMNSGLTAALDKLQAEAGHLGDDAVGRLFRNHVAPVDQEAIERIGADIQLMMTSISQSAAQTGSRAGVFGAQLNGLTEALAMSDVAQITPHLSEVLAGTAAMKTSVEALQDRVAVSQAEIGRLREDLVRARSEAILDSLTGVLNRKGFDQRLKALLEQSMDGAGTSHCLVILDIDHFKKVNDTHGHLVGDSVIQALGEILRTSVTNPEFAAARYGGEEFAILLPRTSIEQSTHLAEAVRTRTKAMKLRNRSTQEILLSVTISGGVAEMRHGDDAASLISRADAALYESKKGGRDRITRAFA